MFIGDSAICYLIMDKNRIYSLRVMEGCICVCCSVIGCVMTEIIWLMKEYKVQSL